MHFLHFLRFFSHFFDMFHGGNFFIFRKMKGKYISPLFLQKNSFRFCISGKSFHDYFYGLDLIFSFAGLQSPCI